MQIFPCKSGRQLVLTLRLLADAGFTTTTVLTEMVNKRIVYQVQADCTEEEYRIMKNRIEVFLH